MEQFKRGLPLEQGSLRQALGQAQWTDPGLRTMCHRLFQSKDDQWAEDANSFRLDGDRTLEIAVMIPGRAVAQWVVVVPDENVRGTETSWKQFCFVAMHTHAGAHLPADKTYQLMTRSGWWKKMKVDVEWWCDCCWQCLQWRRRPQRSPAGSHVSYTQLP